MVSFSFCLASIGETGEQKHITAPHEASTRNFFGTNTGKGGMAPRTGVGTVTRRSRGFWQAGRGQLAELRSVGPFSLTPTGELAVRVQRNFLQFFFA
ncbi:MAG: hypothetical protein DMG37_06880 [Acidobacteria bacterium]|nr:MAG: hypothetical protein DMG37_06880 [Acidobacteriota bacterium]